MSEDLCPVCGKELEAESRSQWCSDRCKDKDLRKRVREEARQALALPTATLTPEEEAQLPSGPERWWAACGLIIRARAPAGAKGYRVGIMRTQTMRWFPPWITRTTFGFSLDPFESPVVPMPGLYVVVYVDGQGRPIGGPRFTLYIPYWNRQLRFSDGDRTLKPRSVR